MASEGVGKRKSRDLLDPQKENKLKLSDLTYIPMLDVLEERKNQKLSYLQKKNLATLQPMPFLKRDVTPQSKNTYTLISQTDSNTPTVLTQTTSEILQRNFIQNQKVSDQEFLRKLKRKVDGSSKKQPRLAELDKANRTLDFI